MAHGTRTICAMSISDAPRVMVVDGSKLVRKLIGDVLVRELPNVEVIGCAGLAEARAVLDAGAGRPGHHRAVAARRRRPGAGARVREAAGQAYVPVIVVSGDAQARLETRSFSEDVTDYFDKALGHSALAAFIRGYVQPAAGRRRARAVRRGQPRGRDGDQAHARTPGPGGGAHASAPRTRSAHLEAHRGSDDAPGADLVLTDVYLKGELSGRDLLDRIRNDFGYGKRALPVLVMTGDANRDNQSNLLREGANDLVLKPIEERLLVTKALFQLRVAQLPEQRSLDA